MNLEWPHPPQSEETRIRAYTGESRIRSPQQTMICFLGAGVKLVNNTGETSDISFKSDPTLLPYLADQI